MGWWPGRRRGSIAKATHWHGELLQYLCAMAKPHLQGAPCTTVIIAKGAEVTAPRGAALQAAVVLHGDHEGSWFTVGDFGNRPWSCNYVVGFYNSEIAGTDERRLAAKLHKLGVPIWSG